MNPSSVKKMMKNLTCSQYLSSCSCKSLTMKGEGMMMVSVVALNEMDWVKVVAD